MDDTLRFIDLMHDSPEFGAAYEVIGKNISPEYLETAEFLKTRLRVRDTGPPTGQEKVLIQDGYTLHLIAAKRKDTVVGAVYGHLISQIGSRNSAIGFVTYLSVLSGSRRKGIGTALIAALRERLDADALKLTGGPLLGMVFEIELEGKEPIKGLVSRLGAQPLDVLYYQPALRPGYEPERMDLWFQPLPEVASAPNDLKLPVDFVVNMIRNLLVMEYVGPEMKGFDLASKPYQAFLESVRDRAEIGFITR